MVSNSLNTKLRGYQRMRQIAAEDEAARRVVEADLFASLGRVATPLDQIAAEQISAAVVKGRRLRLAGRNDTEQRRLIAQLMRASNFKPDKPVQKPERRLSPAERFAAIDAKGVI